MSWIRVSLKQAAMAGPVVSINTLVHAEHKRAAVNHTSCNCREAARGQERVAGEPLLAHRSHLRLRI